MAAEVVQPEPSQPSKDGRMSEILEYFAISAIAGYGLYRLLDDIIVWFRNRWRRRIREKYGDDIADEVLGND